MGLELDLGITPHHGVGLCAHAAAWKKLQTQHLHFVADDRGRVRIVALRDLERFAAETYTIRPGAARSASQRRTKRYSIIGRIVEGREGTTGPRCEIHAASIGLLCVFLAAILLSPVPAGRCKKQPRNDAAFAGCCHASLWRAQSCLLLLPARDNVAVSGVRGAGCGGVDLRRLESTYLSEAAPAHQWPSFARFSPAAGTSSSRLPIVDPPVKK